jgi:tellurite resistance protein
MSRKGHPLFYCLYTSEKSIFPANFIFKSNRKTMTGYSESAAQLREMIEKAIDDHRITREEMDTILNIVSADGHIDPHEQALLNQLQEMIENRTVKYIL